VARWKKGEQTVQYLISRGRLETVEVEDLTASADALIARAVLRVEATAAAALQAGDVMVRTWLLTMPTGWRPNRCWSGRGYEPPK